MEQVVANARGIIRKATLAGREYLVAASTLIVPGVLAGSKGPLFYPPEETSRDPSSWNGIPLVMYHPVVNGLHVSARSPEIVDRQGLGFIFNAGVLLRPKDGKPIGTLQAEAWFDILNTKRIDSNIISKLESGQPIELSTGLFTVNEIAPNGSSYNGKSYLYTARGYKPDHVAVLPDQRGACSVQDGCGINVNSQSTTQPLQTAQPIQAGTRNMSFNKEAALNFLTANCECWKQQGDRDVLANMDDARLERLYNHAVEERNNRLIANTLRQTLPELTVNAEQISSENMSAAMMEKCRRLLSAEKREPAVNTATPTQVVQPLKALTLTEYLTQYGTAEERAVWNNAVSVVEREKVSLIESLTANFQGDLKTRKINWLKTKPIEDLREMVDLQRSAPVDNFGQSDLRHLYTPQSQPAPSYQAAATPGPGIGTVVSDDLLLPPVFNWDEISKAGRNSGRD